MSTADNAIRLHFDVSGDDFTRAGEASGKVKATMKQLGIGSNAVRKVAIAMYEGEINMVIHAGDGEADVEITPEAVLMTLTDHGPGIADIEQAMQEGWSTAPESVRNLGCGAGMGLPNMRKYTDYMDIKTEVGVGTKIVMRVNC